MARAGEERRDLFGTPPTMSPMAANPVGEHGGPSIDHTDGNSRQLRFDIPDDQGTWEQLPDAIHVGMVSTGGLPNSGQNPAPAEKGD